MHGIPWAVKSMFPSMGMQLYKQSTRCSLILIWRSTLLAGWKQDMSGAGASAPRAQAADHVQELRRLHEQRHHRRQRPQPRAGRIAGPDELQRHHELVDVLYCARAQRPRASHLARAASACPGCPYERDSAGACECSARHAACASCRRRRRAPLSQRPAWGGSSAAVLGPETRRMRRTTTSRTRTCTRPSRRAPSSAWTS